MGQWRCSDWEGFSVGVALREIFVLYFGDWEVETGSEITTENSQKVVQNLVIKLSTKERHLLVN